MKYKKNIFIIIGLILVCFLSYYEGFGRAVKHINVDKKYIYKTFKSENVYKRIKKFYKNILHKWDFVPRMKFDDKKLIIKEEYFDNVLTKSNKPFDYVKQLTYIDNTIKNAGLFHNDYRVKGPGHFFLKNGKIYLIDYDGLSKKEHLPRNDIQKIIKQL